MDFKLLTLCLAASLVTVCHGFSTGKEFITTFLPNNEGSREKEDKLNLVLTAQGAKAKVLIQVVSLKFSKKVKLKAGQTKWVSLPSESQLHTEFENPNSAVQIASSADIAVVSFNRGNSKGDGAAILPLRELGTDHVVFTPAGSATPMDSLVAVVNGDSENQITILPGADVTLQGGSHWMVGKAVVVKLAPYSTYLLRSRKSLTGARIQSQKPVAVLAGHQCLSLGAMCEHVYEQLPPVKRLGVEYLVPSHNNRKATSWAAIVAAEDDTKLTMQIGNKPSESKLSKAGDAILQKLVGKEPMVVKSDKKVMVLLLSNNKPSVPFLITLTPTSGLASDWAVDTVGGVPSFIAIMSEREGAASVKVCRNQRCLRSVKWNNVQSNEQWVWSIIPVGRKQSHVTVEGDSDMAVYVYGKNRHGYGTPGTCSGGEPPLEAPTDPCDNVDCGTPQKRCVDGKCVRVSRGICRVVGDSHTTTFDRRKYDFQGSCNYIVATVAQMSSHLPHFTVITKNKHRGSQRVSFGRILTISVYNQTIVIDGRKGKVEVNGELETFPVQLLDGKIKITKSGGYASLTTDFGLNVRYNWNVRLFISVLASYFNQMGGLCGNYNGDRKDDLPEPTGKSLSAVLEMVKPWKLNDSDSSCQDNCNGSCPTCPIHREKRFRRPKVCGRLVDPSGPFAACHKVVHPTAYMDNCVYDVCINKGAKRFLCNNFKSYVDACAEEEVEINPEWRMITHCKLPCPKGSHYEACGSACPNTCTDPQSEKKCKAPCVEGCQCNKGRVLSGDKCVPKSSCGCEHEGKYHEAGKPFWEDLTCTSRCKCENGTAECEKVSCKETEHCGMRKGIRGCYPLSYASCQVFGDRHYLDFIKKRFDYQGTCTYVFSQLVNGSDGDLVPFRVLVTNDNRGGIKAKSLSLTVFGNITVSMTGTRKGQAMVNGRTVNLPYSMGDGDLSVFKFHQFAIVKTNFDLLLMFNWGNHIRLTLPSTYTGATEGLCGNYDGDPAYYLLKADGSLAQNVSEFGDSWKVGGELGCTSDCPGGKCPECTPAMLLHYQKVESCGMMGDMSGPFSDCHSKLDHTPYLNDCMFDQCASNDQAILCESLSVFSKECQEKGAKLGNWRTKKFCPLPCGANSHYEVCAAPCQVTCSELAPPEGCDDSLPCTEDCVCDDGFVLSHDKCVAIAECGCQYDGQYYLSGQVLYPGHDCSRRCVCIDGGEVECDFNFTCTPDEVCVVKDGSPRCSPASVGSCSVGGARTVRPFDGKEYPLVGDCLFTMVEVEEPDKETLEAFSVFVRQQTNESGQVLRSVEIQFHNVEISLESGVAWEIKVDGVRAPLPQTLADGKVRVNQNGIHILVETDFGPTVSYDTVAAVVVRVPTTYHRSPVGLCGNYNGDPSDDQASEDPEEIAAAWLVEGEDNPCPTPCDAVSCPEEDKDKVPEAEKGCDIIRLQDGPFEKCQAKVSPTPYYESCVREMSTKSGSSEVLCSHVQNYVAVCQLSGITIKEWRGPSFCPLKCHPGSHYELCPSTCGSTCSVQQTGEDCPLCQEGCQCDEGLVYNGARCIPVDKCGCMVKGEFYKSGASVLRANCTQRCECQSGQFSCEVVSCGKGEECESNNGTLACVAKECECNGHSNNCSFLEFIDGACESCEHNTTGQHCEICLLGHYQNTSVGLDSERVCVECECVLERSVSTNCSDSGQCQCKAGAAGRRCETCLPGFTWIGAEEGCIENVCDEERLVCKNGGTCVDFRSCNCTEEYTGVLCECLKEGGCDDDDPSSSCLMTSLMTTLQLCLLSLAVMMSFTP